MRLQSPGEAQIEFRNAIAQVRVRINIGQAGVVFKIHKDAGGLVELVLHAHAAIDTEIKSVRGADIVQIAVATGADSKRKVRSDKDERSPVRAVGHAKLCKNRQLDVIQFLARVEIGDSKAALLISKLGHDREPRRILKFDLSPGLKSSSRIQRISVASAERREVHSALNSHISVETVETEGRLRHFIRLRERNCAEHQRSQHQRKFFEFHKFYNAQLKPTLISGTRF
jgi:hypothetical protein